MPLPRQRGRPLDVTSSWTADLRAMVYPCPKGGPTYRPQVVARVKPSTTETMAVIIAVPGTGRLRGLVRVGRAKLVDEFRAILGADATKRAKKQSDRLRGGRWMRAGDLEHDGHLGYGHDREHG